MEDFLEVKASSISGLGVFALKDIEKGAMVGEYKGELLTLKQFEERYPTDDSKYVLDIGDGFLIDARNPDKSNFARYINSTRGTRKRSNVQFVNKGLIVALKKIFINEELLASYGKKYFWR